MKLLSIQDISAYGFCLYFLAFTSETPPVPSELESVENREWLWQRPYTTLEIQHRPGAQPCTPMDLQGEGVSHIMLNEGCDGLGLPDVTSYTHKLRMIREEFFPAQLGAGDVTSHTELEKIIARPELGKNVRAGITGMTVNVRPTTENVVDLR